MESSCARQAPRMRELWDAGCEIRLMRLPHGAFARMHAKSLIMDERVLLTGSVNMTHNGYENNKEHMFRIPEPSVVSSVVEDFDKDWLEAEPLSHQHMTMMMERSEKAKQRRKKGRSTSRSLSKEPSLHRSLSAELEEVEAHAD